MSRNDSAAVTSISQLPNLRYRLLCEVYSLTAGATARTCTGNNFIVFAGNTYSPVGDLGGADPIQEESDVFPRSARIWFSAMNSAGIQEVLAETMFNRPVIIRRTFLTDSLTCVSSPQIVYKGNVNTVEMKLKDPERGNYFELEIDSRLNRNSRSLYFNRETLITAYSNSGSTLFDYIPQIPLTKANWGGMTVGGSLPSTYPGGPGGTPPGRTPGNNGGPNPEITPGGGAR